MKPEVLTLIGQLVVAIIGGGALVAAINNWLSPKAKAETRQIAQNAAREEIDARITNLKEAVDEADGRADAAEKRANAAQARADAISERVTTLQASVESAHEQLDLQSEQMNELRETNRQLKEQNRMLADSLALAEQHARRYFASKGEPMPRDWPRTVQLDDR